MLASPEQSTLLEQAIRHVVSQEEGELTKADLEKVEKLHLIYSPITDAGLKEVAKLKQLNNLYLEGTNVTEAGVTQLEKELLKCIIWY